MYACTWYTYIYNANHYKVIKGPNRKDGQHAQTDGKFQKRKSWLATLTQC